jgi:hypothetical protein
VIALVRQAVDAIAGAEGVDHVEITLRDGPLRAELDAVLGEPAPVPRIPGPAFERFAYQAPDGVSLFADVDDESGRVLAVLVRRDVV